MFKHPEQIEDYYYSEIPSISKNCYSNVYIQDNLQCDENSVWKGPGGGTVSFYTTWSFWLHVGVTFLSIFIFIFYKTNLFTKIKQILTPLIIAVIANIIGVFIVAQLLLVFNWSIKSKKKNLAVSNEFIKKINKVNLIYHQLPLVFIFPLIILLKKYNQPITIKTIIIAMIIISIFFIIWDIVPCKKNKNTNEYTNPFNKPIYVYDHPPAWIMFTLPLSWIIVFLFFSLNYEKNK